MSQQVNYIPKVGVFGKTGAGKSSLCNALFGSKICEVSDYEAMTRKIQAVDLHGKIILFDAPGVGENTTRDKEYESMYKNLIPKLDFIFWIIKSDDRALQPDLNFYNNLVLPLTTEQKVHFMFILNQADKMEPCREWNEKENAPGVTQLGNIEKKKDYVANIFNIPKSIITAVSANENYNLDELVKSMIMSLPKEKRIAVYHNINKEYHRKDTTEEIKKSFISINDVPDISTNGSSTFNKLMDFAIEKGPAIIGMVKTALKWGSKFF